MAAVYRAHDAKHDRDVALKVIHPEYAECIGTDRFLREVQIAASLQHPNILPLYDSGEVDGLPYYVMPLVEGETLRERLERERQLPLPDAISIATEIADAISHAHSHGIVHRDIKPENVLLSGGHAMVADFGIAKAVTRAERQSLTSSGVAVGTPAYMSPEQASGAEEVDHRSDVYSLGCVLYEMLAGEPPFTGPTAQAIVARQLQEEPRSLRVIRPKVTPRLQAVVETALAKVPADRFATATELVAALSKPDLLQPGVGQGRKRRWPIALIVAVVTVLAAAVGVYLWLQGRVRLDVNKVVVFPLAELGETDAAPGLGEEVALLIQTALEYTEPLKWIDGWTQLNESQRLSPRLVTSEAAVAIARAQGARYYLGGVVNSGIDSTTVVLRLHDARGDSVVAQRSASGTVRSETAAELGRRALAALLPSLVDPGQETDFAPLANRNPAAITVFLTGQRQYRNSRFQPALEQYTRAVERDSVFSFAALKGAQSASWQAKITVAGNLIDIAIEHDSLLPPRYTMFAHGFKHYLSGNADSALTHLNSAIQLDPDWSEAWVAIGEVYRHLLPTAGRLDSLAQDAFRRALRHDPSFTPPIVHMAEYALLAGDSAAARDLTERLSQADADTTILGWLTLMHSCITDGSGRVSWQEEAKRDPSAVLEAARMLSTRATYPQCAEDGFRAMLEADIQPEGGYWPAVLTLQSLLVSQAAYDDAVEVLDGALNAGLGAANYLYVLDAMAADRRARSLDQIENGPSYLWDRAAGIVNGVESTAGDDYGNVGFAGTLWLLAVWHSYLAERATDYAERASHAERIGTIARATARKADSLGDADSRLLAEAVAAHAALAQGDTSTAIAGFRSLTPNVRHGILSTSVWQPLALERLILTRVLLARGEYREALEVAQYIDQLPAGISLVYLPESLRLRAQIARDLGRISLAEALEERLAELEARSSTDERGE